MKRRWSSMSKLKRQYFTAPYIIWIIGFILLPILFIVYYGVTDASGSFTLQNIFAIADPIHMKSLLLSLKLALLCTVICLILSYPLAMILNGLHLKRQSFVVFIFVLPMWMNFMLRILAWQLLLSNNGILNTVLSSVGLPKLSLLNTPSAVVFGMVYDFLPFMILPIYNAMGKIGTDIVDAARDLGANRLRVFSKIILPLTVPGILSGVIMVFVPALTSFVISNLLGGGKVLLIGNVIEQEFMQNMDWNMGSGLSIVLMIFVIASMTFMSSHNKEGGGAAVW